LCAAVAVFAGGKGKFKNAGSKDENYVDGLLVDLKFYVDRDTIVMLGFCNRVDQNMEWIKI
jgi:hypothetical protein